MSLKERQARWRKKVLLGAGSVSLIFALLACVPTQWYNQLACAVIAAEIVLYAIIEYVTCRSMELNER